MKNKNMTTEQLLEKFSIERNLSENTIKNYRSVLKHFENFTKITLPEMLNIATEDKNKHKNWDETHLYNWLVKYRNYCYKTENYKENTTNTKLLRVKAFFKHFKIPIYDLPYFSTKQVRKSEEIDYEDLPDRETIRKCINIKNPLLRALTLLFCSSGISRTDVYNLTIQDYLNSTFDYHHCNNIYAAMEIMEKSDISIVPGFKLQRKKTGETYRTFASPEAVKAIHIYLLSRPPLENNDKLFKVNFRYLNDLFKETNDKLGLGIVNGRIRFSPQMLRSFHATQLSEAGMNDSFIDLLQGRRPKSIARKSYIRVKRQKLKEEYIRCLPFLTIEDIEKVKTELDIVKDENTILKEQNEKYKELVDNIDERIERKIFEAMKEGLSEDEFKELFS